jgi:hypothetical protein
MPVIWCLRALIAAATAHEDQGKDKNDDDADDDADGDAR